MYEWKDKCVMEDANECGVDFPNCMAAIALIFFVCLELISLLLLSSEILPSAQNICISSMGHRIDYMKLHSKRMLKFASKICGQRRRDECSIRRSYTFTFPKRRCRVFSIDELAACRFVGSAKVITKLQFTPASGTLYSLQSSAGDKMNKK